MYKSLFTYLLAFASLICTRTAFGQTYKVINYQCLEAPFELLTANHDNTVTYCMDGLMHVDTLEGDCYEFYEEDLNVFRGWFYNDLDSEGNIQFDFDRITLHEDDTWLGETTKYFELERAGFWITLPSLEDPHTRFALQLKDLSGAGMNIGFSLEDGPIYFPNIEEVVQTDFPGLDLSYEDETLTVDGRVRNVYIGGDHIYFGPIELSELITSTTVSEDPQIRLFPNPTANRIHIESEQLLESEVRIYSIAGVLQAVKPCTGTNIQFDLSSLPGGAYWVQIWKNKKLLHTTSITKI